MEPQTNPFWQANFWGIIGTISGLSGVLISWINHNYNTPKIEIDRANLIIPDKILIEWSKQSLKQLNSAYLEYKLEIVVRNSKGGAGSVDKPNLLIKIPSEKRLLGFPCFRTIRSFPETEHQEYEKESENTTKFWTVRHGKAFNLEGGEKVDDKLEYSIENPEMVYQIAHNFEKIKYLIEYRDNKGKKYVKEITEKTNESTLS